MSTIHPAHTNNMIKTLLYLAKDPGPGVIQDLHSFYDYDITVCACNPGYVDYYKLLGYNVITSHQLFEGVDMKFDVVVGNPPYGSGANLAIKFVNKCAELSDDIRMVLPLSFQKVSVQNKVRLDLICIEDNKLPDDTFPNGIRACYQRWVKTDNIRQKVKTLSTHPDFEFVDKESADIMIGRIGGGPAGRVKLNDFKDYSNEHYFIKASDQAINNLLSIADKLRQLSISGNNIPTLSKHDLITCYIENFGRSKIIKPRTHEDFEFLKYEDRFNANVFIGEYGCGPSGRVKTENFTHYAKGHYFIKAKNQSVINRLVSLEPKFRAKASGCNGRYHISKGELIEIYSLSSDVLE